VGFVAVPAPYDFNLSLDRFTFWGVDRANVWHDGGLHRVVDGREVRITPAPAGVQVEPLDDTIELVIRKLLGLELELEPFHAIRSSPPPSAASPGSARRSLPIRSRRSYPRSPRSRCRCRARSRSGAG
jgi:hypothetical protein